MLILALCALWCIGAILIATDPGKESTRWASLMTFVGGLGFLSVIIDDTLRPYLSGHMNGVHTLDSFLQLLANTCSFIEKTMLPYGYIMFAISYCDFFDVRRRHVLAWTLLLPVAVMFCLTPLHPEIKVNYILMLLWTGPYIMSASLFLLQHHLQEKNPLLQRGHLLVNIIGIFPMTCYLFTIYIARTIGMTGAWRWNMLAVILMVAAFLFFGVKHDIFGIKLRFEKHRFDSTMRAVTSGATLLNHSIKNEIGKIHLFLDRIQTAASGNASIDQDIQTIQISTHNLLQLAQLFHRQSQDIILKETSGPLLSIVQDAVSGLQPLLENKQIGLAVDLSAEIDLTGDRFHLQETLNNILMNAIEAASIGGSIVISLSESNKYAILAIQDNGCGIEKQNLPLVYDPFFSTKKHVDNYGLGLSYCCNVMNKHGGSMDIHSVINVGTTVFLHFPKYRIADTSHGRRGRSIGENQGLVG